MRGCEEANKMPSSVDRDEVDRLRKRFMKLDKVGRILSNDIFPTQQNTSADTKGAIRTIAGRSNEKNFFHYPKSPRILSRLGTHPCRALWLSSCSGNNPPSTETSMLTNFLSMIAIFVEDGGGDVDFQEFVSGLSAFSSKGNK